MAEPEPLPLVRRLMPNEFLSLSDIERLLADAQFQHELARARGMAVWSDALRKRILSLLNLKARKEARRSHEPRRSL